MGWFMDLMKDLPLAGVQREHRELIAEKLRDAERRIEDLTSERDALALRVQQLEPAVDREFVISRGLLWRREGDGFEPAPYCPTCRQVMLGFPQWGRPLHWMCSPCGRNAPYAAAPAAGTQ